MPSSDEPDSKGFLTGPLLKQATGPFAALETYDEHWRPGAQAIGFKNAASILVEYVIEGQGRTGHTLLHPILYLFRHSIELRLKGLIQLYDGVWLSGHDIADLWQRTLSIMRRFMVDEGVEDLERLLLELHQVDPKGEAFRYTVTSKGNVIEIGPSEIDVEHLQQQMSDIDIALSGVATMLEQAADFAAELQR